MLIVFFLKLIMISAALLSVPMEQVSEVSFIVHVVRSLQPWLQYGKCLLGSKFLMLKGKLINVAFLHTDLQFYL